MNIKKVLTISALPIMAIVLSGCGAKPAAQAPTPVPVPVATPVIQQPVAQPEQTPAAPTITAPAKMLPPLPANTKAAIDTEISNIDKELQAADSANAKDTTDPSLGL